MRRFGGAAAARFLGTCGSRARLAGRSFDWRKLGTDGSGHSLTGTHSSSLCCQQRLKSRHQGHGGVAVQVRGAELSIPTARLISRKGWAGTSGQLIRQAFHLAQVRISSKS